MAAKSTALKRCCHAHDKRKAVRDELELIRNLGSLLLYALLEIPTSHLHSAKGFISLCAPRAITSSKIFEWPQYEIGKEAHSMEYKLPLQP